MAARIDYRTYNGTAVATIPHLASSDARRISQTRCRSLKLMSAKVSKDRRPGTDSYLKSTVLMMARKPPSS